jgi:hypothetical protein
MDSYGSECYAYKYLDNRYNRVGTVTFLARRLLQDAVYPAVIMKYTPSIRLFALECIYYYLAPYYATSRFG